MADLFNNLTVARQEWQAADADYKVAAVVIAECVLKYGSVTDARLEEYRVAKSREIETFYRYQAISHADEEVSA